MATELATRQDNLPVEAATSILSVIERAARSPDVDVEKMERLFALQERIVAREAETAFNAAMQAAQSEMPRIKRDAENRQTQSLYARLESVNQKVVPIYTKHGFSLSFGSADCPLEGHIRITCLVSHSAGHSRTYQCDVPLDLTGMKGTQNKTATHAFGSTMSYGRRYLTLLIFNISLTNEDTDGNAGDAHHPVEPEGYEKWRMDMEAVAGEGRESLKAAWAKSSPKFRTYATTVDANWWETTKGSAK